MEKWSDRPASDDHMEMLLDKAYVLLKPIAPQLAKFAPPVIGFSLFLLYFHANHFYPSFDLLQFSSLLLSASGVGFAIIGFIFLALLLPGQWIFHGFMNTSVIREGIKKWLPEENSDRHALWMLGLLFLLPYSLCSLLLSSIAIQFPGMYLISLILGSLLVVLVIGLVIQLQLKLPKFTFFRYLFNAWVPVMVVNGLAFSLLADTKDFINGLDGDFLKLLAIYLIPLGCCIVAAVCSITSIGGLKFTAPFSLFFALIIAFYSGILAGLPDRVMQQLGLGNYQAQSVLFKPDYCKGEMPAWLGLGSSCSLKDVHVIWGLGETYSFLIEQDGKQRQVQVPSKEIKAIVRER
ncbi:hypothetical protein [Pseudomonas sp. TUM22785]|uniref:hypothetical protein n=1 Tax=Pseudomonas sp. TUM22785 TaxID=3019098 RepID=UPI002306B11E|nr:hypothetical protein [Pseudomonas sp. TUM22785]WCD78888.1 hypothetical protein PI990_23225 [Pseudomonas sp. TUM22785]